MEVGNEQRTLQNDAQTVASSVRKRVRENTIRQIGTPQVGLRRLRPSVLARNTHVPNAQALPEVIQKHFVQLGAKFYFADGTHVFTDHHTKLTTRSENTQLIRDLVSIAQARGWSQIAVAGTQHFRREAWATASTAGLTVKGYRPSAVEQAHLAKRAKGDPEAAAESQNPTQGARSSSKLPVSAAHPGEVRSPPRPEAHERSHSGVLLAHGPAPYRHDPHEPMSYVVRVETRAGEQEVWGVDLERALRESLSRATIGDEVVLRAVGRERVMVRAESREPTRESAGAHARETHRNRWQVETRAFLLQRKEAAQVLRDPDIEASLASQRHPQLLGAYLQLQAAELAAKQFRDVEDRRRFMSMVREALAQGVARGEPLPAVRLRQDKEARTPDHKARDGSLREGRVR
jgi:Large polyvalent protein-associated domain 7